MASQSSPVRSQTPTASNMIRQSGSGLERRTETAVRLDEIDHILLRELSLDARVPNNALAAKAGIAPSTCLARVRQLRESGVIRGFHADVDQALAGRSLQAIIAVRMQGHARGRLSAYLRQLAELPGVLNVFLLGGAHDFFVHVAAPDSDALNAFVVENLSSNRDVALTETNLIFQHARSPQFS
ncbi:MAG: Lrp/AsnC family transcriptional regulator [Nocardioides sp.]|uniref:Lrp/AsnC family transcriptional regulator n=1 Tax=Nocardioides sp. TaxID=35761 RepID=UPI0039E70749